MKTKKQGSMLLKITIILVALVIICTGTAGFFTYRKYMGNITPLNSQDETKKSVTIEPGTTAKGVGILLEREAIIRSSWAFEWYMRREKLNSRIKAGIYRLGPSLSVGQIAEMITEGKVETKLVQFLPGKRLDQIKQVLLDEGYSEQEVARALDIKTYQGHPVLVDVPAGGDLEGYIYPDSYQKTAGTKAEVLVRNALDLMEVKLTPELRAGFTKQGLTAHQAIIIASIVEKEVGKLSDKPYVAQVFLTRYKIGMELGADPTAFYGSARDGKPEVRSVAYDSPYNTRLYKGLPPGPISNVTQASLAAVASPAPTDYIYFVAGDDGTTHFSKTLSEHESLTRQYCTKLCGR